MNQSVHKEPDQRTNGDYLELWRHHAAFGGEDKNRMVTIASFLLGVSAGVLGIIVALPMDDTEWIAFEKPRQAVMVSALGISISIIAAYTVLLYAGYANQNWQKANDIAEPRGWNDLLPPRSQHPPEVSAQHPPEVSWLVRFIYWLAKECDPRRNIAPVFTVFAVLSFLFFLMHLVIFIRSISLMG